MKRYDCGTDFDAGHMVEYDDGEYVLFTDIEPILKVLQDVADDTDDCVSPGVKQTARRAILMLKHGVTEQDIAETMPPEPGR